MSSLLVLLALIGAPAHAATPTTLDLDTVQALARAQTATVQSADLSLQSSQLSLDSASKAWQPNLSAHTGANSGWSPASGTTPTGSLSAGLSSSMPIYEGGTLVAQKQAARARVTGSQASLDQAKSDAVWQASDALLAIGEAQLEVQVQQSAVKDAQALLDQVQTLVTAGSKTKADLYAQQAQVAQQQAALVSANQQLQDDQLALLSLLRLNPAAEWTFVAPTSAPSLSADPSALTATALQNRSDLKAAASQVTAAQADQRAAFGQGLPSVSLSVGVSTSLDPFSGDPAGKQLADSLRGTVGVTVGFDIFDRGARQDRNASAAIGVEKAQLSLETANEQAGFDVRRLLAAQQSAQASVEAQTAQVASAKQAADVLALRYGVGEATLYEVSAAQTAEVNAEIGLARAQSSLSRVGYQLAYTTGELD